MSDTRKAIPISADEMEALAFEGGLTIEIRADHAVLKMRSGRRFVAPLPLPEQRKPGSES